MIEFTLFGIPIRIQPWHWIGLAIIGGALNIRDASDLLIVALFMIVGFLAILLHELGHALVGRKLGGGGASIDLVMLGGYTQHYDCRLKGKQNALVIAAGPASTFLFGVIGFFLCLFLMKGSLPLALEVTTLLAANPYTAFNLVDDHGLMMQLYFVGCMLFVSFWWTLFNILPIYPLDGGQLLAQYVKSPKRVYLIGIITAVIVGFLAFTYLGSILLTAFMAFFAYGNFKSYQSSSF